MKNFVFCFTQNSMILLMCLVATLAQATQSSSPYTTANRYDVTGRITGMILPDPDGSGPLKHGATRNSYNPQGLLDITENGELALWQNELVRPSEWGTNFTVISSVKHYYDDKGRLIGKAVRDDAGQTISFTQMNYDSLDRVVCQASRINAIRLTM